MNRKFLNTFSVLAAAIVLSFGSLSAHANDLIQLDTTSVLLAPLPGGFFTNPADEPRFRQQVAAACVAAEAHWESRMIGYSTEIPNAVRMQVPNIKISCEIADLGAGGILAQAGPNITTSYTRKINVNGAETNTTLTLDATITFNIQFLEFMATNNELVPTAVHEMCHCFGFGGFIMGENGLTGPLNGVGLNQYIGGQYALQAFRRESGNPVASFIPLEQSGAGSAGSHWAAGTPAFDMIATQNRQEVMLATAGPIGVEYFTSESTFGLLADLGYAVTGFNDHLVAPLGIGKWDKISGSGSGSPFAGQGIDLDPDGRGAHGHAHRKVKIRVPYYKHGQVPANTNAAGGLTVGSGTSGPGSATSDPFRLRNQNWNRTNKAAPVKTR